MWIYGIDWFSIEIDCLIQCLFLLMCWNYGCIMRIDCIHTKCCIILLCDTVIHMDLYLFLPMPLINGSLFPNITKLLSKNWLFLWLQFSLNLRIECYLSEFDLINILNISTYGTFHMWFLSFSACLLYNGLYELCKF